MALHVEFCALKGGFKMSHMMRYPPPPPFSSEMSLETAMQKQEQNQVKERKKKEDLSSRGVLSPGVHALCRAESCSLT